MGDHDVSISQCRDLTDQNTVDIKDLKKQMKEMIASMQGLDGLMSLGENLE